MVYQPWWYAKTIFVEEHQWYYLTHSWDYKAVHTFPHGICLKWNIIARLEFELTFYDVIVQHINHYSMRAPLSSSIWILLLYMDLVVVLHPWNRTNSNDLWHVIYPVLLISIWSGHLGKIWWLFCISKSLRSVWVSFSRINSRFYL